jgi:hypothetical protein
MTITMLRNRAIIAVCSAVACAGLLIPAVGSASGAAVTRCGVIHASVPYSHHGNHDTWRVYVKGAASCSSAIKALNAVMHLNGKQHAGSSNADSYVTSGTWTCDFGQMGSQDCVEPAHTPYKAAAVALDCSLVACPVRLPRDQIP